MESAFIKCQYCLENVPSNDILNHSFIHLLFKGQSSDYCKLCNEAISIESIEIIIDHMAQWHNRDRRCPLCLSLTDSFDHLYYHLKANISTIYHCVNSNCFFITTERMKLRTHLSEFKHKSKKVSKEFIINCKNIDKMMSIVEEEDKFFNSAAFSRRKIINNAIIEEKRGEIVENKQEIISKIELTKKMEENTLEINSKIGTAKKIGEILENKQEISSKIVTAKKIGRKVAMNFSLDILKKNFRGKNDEFLKKVLLKLRNMPSFLIGINEGISGEKVYVCIECKYSSSHSHAHVRRHILCRHCKLTQVESNLCMSACGFDSNLQQNREKYSKKNEKEMEEINKGKRKNLILSINGKLMISNIPIIRNKKISDKSSENEGINEFGIDEQMKENGLVKKQFEDDKIYSKFPTEIKTSDIKKTFKMDYSNAVLKKYFLNSQKHEKVLIKLKNAKSYSIGIKLIKNITYYVCMECEYSLLYSNGDVRRHILTQHCQLNSSQSDLVLMASMFHNDRRLFSDCDNLADSLLNNNNNNEEESKKQKKKEILLNNNHFSSKDKNEENQIEIEKNLEGKSIIENKRKRKTKQFFDEDWKSINISEKKKSHSVNIEIDKIEKAFNMDYSDLILRKIIDNDEDYNRIILKLVDVRSYLIGVTVIDNARYFVCICCKYSSSYCHGHIRRHILTKHCGLSQREKDLVLQTSLYSADYRLLSDIDLMAVLNGDRLTNNNKDFEENKENYVKESKIRKLSNKEEDNSEKKLAEKLDWKTIKNKEFEEAESKTLLESIDCSARIEEDVETTKGTKIRNRNESKNRNCEKTIKTFKINFSNTDYKKSINGKVFKEIKKSSFEKNKFSLGIEEVVEANKETKIKNCKSDQIKNPEKTKKTFKMDFSDSVYRKLINNEGDEDYQKTVSKSKFIRTHSITVINLENIGESYLCDNCDYSSLNSHLDVRRHILTRHCRFTKSQGTLILDASRYNDDFELISDSEMIDIINREKSLKNEKEQNNGLQETNETWPGMIEEKDESLTEIKAAKGTKIKSPNNNKEKNREKKFVKKSNKNHIEKNNKMDFSDIAYPKSIKNKDLKENQTNLIFESNESSPINIEEDAESLTEITEAKRTKIKNRNNDKDENRRKEFLKNSNKNNVEKTKETIKMDHLDTDNEKSMKSENFETEERKTFLEKNEHSSEIIVEDIKDKRKGNYGSVTDITKVFKVDYSERVLKKCLKNIDKEELKELIMKLEHYRTFSMGLAEKDGKKSFVCMTCNKSSTYYLSDIQKHILGKHCRVQAKYMNLIIKVSKCDVENRILPDNILIESFNKKKKINKVIGLLSDSEDDE